MQAEETAITVLCERLRVPQECRELALLAARYHADIAKASALPVASLLWLLQATDALRRPERFMQLLDICAVAASNPAMDPAVARLRDALAAARAIDAGAIAQGCAEPGRIKERVAQARLAAIEQALAAMA